MASYLDGGLTDLRVDLAFNVIFVAFSLLGIYVAFSLYRRAGTRDTLWIALILGAFVAFFVSQVFALTISAQQYKVFQGEDEDEYDSQDWDPTTYVALEVLDKFWYIVADICIAGLFCCTSYGSKGRAIALAAFLLFTLLAFVEFALSTWATVEQLLVRNSGDDYGDPYASRDRERKAQQDAVDADYVFLAYCCYSFVYFAGFVAVVVALASRGTNRKSAAMLLTLAIIFINAQLVFYIARIALGMTANIEYLNPSLGVAFSVVEGVFYLATLFTLAVMGSQRLSLHTYT